MQEFNPKKVRALRLNEEFCLGQLSEVSGAKVVLEFNPRRRTSEASSTEAAEVSIPPTSVGEFLLVEADNAAVVLHLHEIKRSPEGKTLAVAQPVMTYDLVTQELIRGVSHRLNLGAKVFGAPAEIAKLIADFGQRELVDERSVVLRLGELLHNSEMKLNYAPEMIFGRHCVILGTSGSGKSWSIAHLVEECSRYNAKVILIDATGEYAALSNKVQHVSLGGAEKRADSMEVVLPYFHLTENDLFAIFKPNGQSQGPKLRAAMKSLKLAMKEPSLALNGVIIKVHKSKTNYEAAYRKHIAYIDRPNAEFEISCLARQIENECVQPNRSNLEPQFWGDINSFDHSLCMPLVSRIEDIIHSPHLSTIFFPERKPSLLRTIDSFMSKESEDKVLRVSLEHLSFAHNAREIITNAIGRHLLMRARDYKYRDCPLVVILDEAHQFVNKQVGEGGDKYPLDAFDYIAKEGRKYGLSICLATQRPRDLPEGVLSQVGTFIVHRLINDLDRRVVERACGQASAATMEMLPTLGPGEAVMLGVDFPLAVPLRMASPEAAPNSKGSDFQTAWR